MRKSHRSFGGDRAGKPAVGDAEVGVCTIDRALAIELEE
jgi:hypothetical protein